jgi:ElaB/YqjD/DUF883 family membrane-anchored ribosome-binding protein
MPTSRRKSTSTARLRNGAHERVDAVADSIDSLRATANDYVDRGREQVTDLARTFEDSVRERPLTALLIGVGIGFVMGSFMSRRA